MSSEVEFGMSIILWPRKESRLVRLYMMRHTRSSKLSFASSFISVSLNLRYSFKPKSTHPIDVFLVELVLISGTWALKKPHVRVKFLGIVR